MAGRRKRVTLPGEPAPGAYVVTPEIKQKFLALYEAEYRAFFPLARELGVSGQAVDDAMVRDPEFGDAVYYANQRRIETLETEAYHRAVVGWDEPIYYKGIVIGSIRRKSDRLLELLLRAHRPDKYRDHAVIESAAGGGVLVLEQPMTAAMWEAVAARMRQQNILPI